MQRHAALAVAIGCSFSMGVLAAPPDEVNAFNVGEFSETVDAKMNIFSAGQPAAVNGTSCTAASEDSALYGNTSAGILPLEIEVPSNAVWVSFETVTKTSDFGSTHDSTTGVLQVDPTYHSGDGWSPNGQAVTTLGTPVGVDVSGIYAPGTLFLTGVFRNADAAQTSGGPAARDYRVPSGSTVGTWWAQENMYGNWNTRFDRDIQRIFVNTNQPTYEDIILNQSFWVGDGRDKFEVVDGALYYDGSPPYSLGPATQGEVQYFKIPEGTTRLYLGFADGQNFGGRKSHGQSQGCYGDNQGTLAVSGTFWGPQEVQPPVAAEPTPVPTLNEWALMLLGLGVAGLAARRRMR